MSVLQEQYRKEIAPKLQKDLKIKNVHDVPALKKVIVNVGIGTYMKNHKDYSPISNGLETITGQKPRLINAKISVSNFKLREGTPNGLKVTLRDKRMYDFVYKLVNTALPRVRDFQGIPNNSFDGNGNYSLGIKDHTIFPEVDIDDNTHPFSLEVTFVTSTNDDETSKVLLAALGFPLKKPKE